MPARSINLGARLATLKSVLRDPEHQRVVHEALETAHGDWSAAEAELQKNNRLPEPVLRKVGFAQVLADWSDDNVSVVQALAEPGEVSSLREVALRFNVEKLAAVVDPQHVPDTVAGADDSEKKRNAAVALRRGLYVTEPTAVLRRMVEDAEVPITDVNVRAGVATFLANQPDFNIRTTSVYTALRNPEAFRGIPEEQRMGVTESVKTLQRVQAVSLVPEAVGVLMKANLTSAFRITEMPQTAFVTACAPALDAETAGQIYTHAMNISVRNEHALMTIRETLRGTGGSILDGGQTPEARLLVLQAKADEQGVPLNLETLFGSMDYCECAECQSVYSPAAYFVELLQFLRNNDLDPQNPHTGQKGIKDTPLEKLFRRRPDLGCLELTCENTNTILPYVDLVNEVMESFVVHLSKYCADPNTPKQATLEAFNVEDETSSELLAQPQHTNYRAYCILKSVVYPFTLPYHQPIDAARIFLQYLGTSRYELLKRYRTATETCPRVVLTPAEQQELQTRHQTVLDRAVDAEYLGLTQEEYIILTREAFWPRRYFEITQKTSLTERAYRKQIGVKEVHEYYGYAARADLLDADENPQTGQKGLTFVKKQFLPRTGLEYTDLVELLKTRCINPNFPQGQARTILESLRFSYRFLQTLVDQGSTDPKVKYARLVDFLEKSALLLPRLDALLHPDPCHQHQAGGGLDCQDLPKWVYCYFERVGKLIVLEAGEKPQLPIEGKLFKREDPKTAVGALYRDGTIVDPDGTTIGNVQPDMTVVWEGGKTLEQLFGVAWLMVCDSDEWVGLIDANGLSKPHTTGRIAWLPPQDTCNLDKVRLVHLDGTAVTVEEYDRMQRFIRLWRKMGWTIDETDKALFGLTVGATQGVATAPGTCDYVGFDTFKDDCSCAGEAGSARSCDCPDLVPASCDITPDFIHQLVAVRKLLDLTGLPVIKLLTFWADISTAGEKSLYSRLFLTHNLLGIDKVFQPDKHGNYLTQAAKISEHLPVLLAALRLKADDIAAVMDCRQLPDALTLANVSALYRHGLLAKALHLKVADLSRVIPLFGDPFQNADQTLTLFKTWGKMEDAGFTFGQLDYIICGHDDALRPLAPAQKKVLQIAKTLYDGLNKIDADHPDVTEGQKAEATADLIRAKAALLFTPAVVEQIIGLLEGTTVYATNAPAHQTIAVPAPLTPKLKYNDPQDVPQPHATIQVIGILTEDERTQAKALSSHPEWAKAIDRVGKQALHFFEDVLAGIFRDATEVSEAKGKLLAGDVALPASQQDPTVPDPNTAPIKRFYFLQHLLPFLRRRLAHRFLVDTLSGAAGLPNDVTDVLLSNVLVVGNPSQPALNALEKIKEKPAGAPDGWKGYLIPSVAGAYTFIAKSETAPAALLLDGQLVPFPHQQDDPSDVWSSDPVTLKNGKLYRLEVTGLSVAQLLWRTAAAPAAALPASALLPDYSSQGVGEAFTKLYKSALLVNGFSLTADEVSYWQTHPADFEGFDFNQIGLKHWRRLQAYTAFRDQWAHAETTLLDLFAWAGTPDDSTKLSEKIATVTGWKKENVEKLIAAKHFDLNRPEAFRNEVALVKLQKAVAVADKIGVDVDRLFDWAKPGSQFWLCHRIAEDIRNAVRARYDQEDWEKVVKPLQDQLREDQKQALISYLLVQPELRDWGVVDADSLFEFFLIDVQMGTCRETSRIKQAISTVQLFVQRCLLGLEEKYGVPNTITVNGQEVPVLDRQRWEWMQRYRVWEANRKVFLYPENWIESSLRDDKSPFFKELESELLQKDINPETVANALKSYLFKVDEVANLKVVGLFLEYDTDLGGKQVPIKLHVFARTRHAPYFFHYRYFDTRELNWYPWEKVQVDIPSYDSEDAEGKATAHGTYLIPVVLNKRLLVFFPQLSKKTAPLQGDSLPVTMQSGTNSDGSPSGTTTMNVPTKKSQEYWEIRMAWSEYRNGKWAQKQLSAEAVYDSLGDVKLYEFVPHIDPAAVVIDAIYQTSVSSVTHYRRVGAFYFRGSQLAEIKGGVVFGDDEMVSARCFHYNAANEIHSLQAKGVLQPLLCAGTPYFTVNETSAMVNYDGTGRNFSHPFAHNLLSTLTSANLDGLFDYYHDGGYLTVTDKKDTFGADPNAVYQELKRSYSLYNWEAAFHAPMLFVDRLLQAQQYERALKMCHYVFNPLAPGTGAARFWQFAPFQEIDAENVLERLFMGLQSNQPDGPINEWRERPFQPHVVARSRPSAYMKWVVMKYVDILIAYGDYYFRQKQNMLEAMPMAIQCYVLAAHIFGPRRQKIPRRGKIQPQTYNSLLDKWDAFSNAMVELELVFPYSNQIPGRIGARNGVVGLANVFGFASTLYFCLPDNPHWNDLRATVEDRLFKIRHCQDIDGVFFQPPLFEPPIEPGLLVQAVAQGLSLENVLNDLDSPMPNYRFYYLLQKALELCTELKALGNAFLSAKEKGDAEALSQVRARHESGIQTLVMEVKKQQLEETQKSLDALQQSRKGPVYRLQHYLKLIGEDLGKVPSDNTDFSELPNQIEQPVDESGLKLIHYEKEEMDKASAAADWQIGIGIAESLASVFHALPIMHADGHPLGVGADVAWGMPNLGHATQALARGLKVYADHLSYQSSSAGRKGGFLRQLQDRVQQANAAGYEIKNIDKQILTQQIRINIAEQEITNQQQQIDNAQEVEEFLRNKYTNQELYSWMEGSIRTLYHQVYTLAYDLAKKAEKAYCFERGLASSNFIQFGYWDAARDGLLAGERLYLGLKQLEAAYQEKRGHDYELSKPVSLRQINPLALLQLRETGTCEFALPEVLFDMDHAGHYLRRIKSVALTIPCVVGPYTSLNCTLRLLEHKFRTSAIAKDKNDYREKLDETDDRFRTVHVPITAIAASTGQNDSGVFELNFRDERYIPFEGAGAISKWRLELPAQFRQFDYDTITDVILHLRYTAVDGGDKLKQPAAESVQEYLKSVEDLSQEEGLFAAFDLRQDFSNEWYQANQLPADATERVLAMNDLCDRLPIFTKGRSSAKIRATDVYLLTSAVLPASSLVLTQAVEEFPFTPGSPVGTTMKSFAINDNDIPMSGWQLKIQDTEVEIDKLWLVVRYTLT